MNTAPLIDHIVWDWNGTIFGDSRALIDATIEAFAACGLPSVDRSAYQRHHTQPITDFYERLAGRILRTMSRSSSTDASMPPTPVIASW